jgi:hypothetical protein
VVHKARPRLTDKRNYREQFDRFSQEAYLRLLLETDADEVVPTVFLDLMTRVNLIEGQVSIILSELEQSDDIDLRSKGGQLIAGSSKQVLENIVDAASILKALMEHYELRAKHES